MPRGIALETTGLSVSFQWLVKLWRIFWELLKTQALISFLWWPGTGPEWMAWSCVRGGLSLVLGKSSSHRGGLGTGIGSPGKWSQHWAWQSSRSLWKCSQMWCDFWDCPAQGQELTWWFFQLRIFYIISWFYERGLCLLKSTDRILHVHWSCHLQCGGEMAVSS